MRLPLEFDYEIGIEEYIDSTLATWKLVHFWSRIKKIGRSLLLVSVIAVFLWGDYVNASAEGEFRPGFAFIIAAFFTAWTIIANIRWLFLESQLKKSYAASGLSGVVYHARISDDGIEVRGPEMKWNTTWEYVLAVHKSGSTISLQTRTVHFIFGRRFLKPDHQSQLEEYVSSLPTSAKTPSQPFC